MLKIDWFLRRLYVVFRAETVLFCLPILFLLSTCAIAKETIKLVETLGSPGTGVGQFSNIWDIATDGNGNLYVAEENSRIQKFTYDGEYLVLLQTEMEFL